MKPQRSWPAPLPGLRPLASGRRIIKNETGIEFLKNRAAIGPQPALRLELTTIRRLIGARRAPEAAFSCGHRQQLARDVSQTT